MSFSFFDVSPIAIITGLEFFLQYIYLANDERARNSFSAMSFIDICMKYLYVYAIELSSEQGRLIHPLAIKGEIMKKIIFLLMMLSVTVYAQESEPPGFHTHDGFYLSMNIGPGFGKINWEATNFSFKKAEFGGTGGQFEFRIGGVVAENFILSFDLLGRSILNPDMTQDGRATATINNLSVSDVIIGGGLTYYFMPANIFVSGSAGLGSFSIKFENSGSTGSTKQGLGFQFKAGKEWWISTEWALGISAGIAYVSADDKPVSNYTGKFSTTRFFVLFNTTFN